MSQSGKKSSRSGRKFEVSGANDFQLSLFSKVVIILVICCFFGGMGGILTKFYGGHQINKWMVS